MYVRRAHGLASIVSVFRRCLPIGVAVPSDHALVAPDGSGDWPTLQEAVQAAANGDIVRLLSGTFTGPDNREVRLLGKSIIIESSSGDPGTCIIDCESAGVGFLIVDGEGWDTAIRNLTVTRGHPPTL